MRVGCHTPETSRRSSCGTLFRHDSKAEIARRLNIGRTSVRRIPNSLQMSSDVLFCAFFRCGKCAFSCISNFSRAKTGNQTIQIHRIGRATSPTDASAPQNRVKTQTRRPVVEVKSMPYGQKTYRPASSHYNRLNPLGFSDSRRRNIRTSPGQTGNRNPN